MELHAWIGSLRLRTLPLALSAILLGNTLAYWQQQFNIEMMFLSLITAALLQILSNLANDYGDAIKGSDKVGRLGPMRGIQQGLISIQQLRIAVIISLLLSIIFGLLLLKVSCDSLFEFIGFILLGLLSIIAAITYTVGKKPYGYIGVGDLAVLLFFGLVGIMGSYYLQTKQLPMFLLLPAIASGLLSVAVLNINNLRDIQGDKLNNKRTLVVLIGFQAGRYYHLTLLCLSFCLFALFSYFYLHTLWSWLFLISLPFYIIHIKLLFTVKQQAAVAPLFVQMAKLTLLTNLLFCLGIILS